MHRISFILSIALLLSPVYPALSEDKPSGPEYSEAAKATRKAKVDGLLARLKAAKSEAEGHEIQELIGKIWTTGPNSEATTQLAEAIRKRRGFNLGGSLADLDRLVEDYPEFMEARNQRAFVKFLRRDYEASLHDLHIVLEMEPRHFAAWSGRALVLRELGRMERAQAALRKAVAIHPWIMERFLLEGTSQ